VQQDWPDPDAKALLWPSCCQGSAGALSQPAPAMPVCSSLAADGAYGRGGFVIEKLVANQGELSVDLARLCCCSGSGNCKRCCIRSYCRSQTRSLRNAELDQDCPFEKLSVPKGQRLWDRDRQRGRTS